MSDADPTGSSAASRISDRTTDNTFSHTQLVVPLQKLHDDAVVPQRARHDDAGVDLVSLDHVRIACGGGRALVRTGIAVALSPGFAGFVVPRSGLAAKHGVTVTNAPGLIDAGYRGELMVSLVNTDPHVAYEVQKGERVAQLVVMAVAETTFALVDELAVDVRENARGTGGFGHTGSGAG